MVVGQLRVVQVSLTRGHKSHRHHHGHVSQLTCVEGHKEGHTFFGNLQWSRSGKVKSPDDQLRSDLVRPGSMTTLYASAAPLIALPLVLTNGI